VEGIQVNAMTEPVNFTLPKKPRIYAKDPLPDQRKVSVVPIKAVFDPNISHGALHVLAALCSYCNRAGITWVSQTRLAKELNITQQAVAKQFKQLRELGYLETVKKGFKGERTDTLRVIFDKSVDAATAMAVTSSMEDTRSPAIKEQQAMEEVDREGQRRVAQAISKVLKQPTKRSPTMPKSGETRTVREMKAAIQKAQSKQSKTVDKPVDKQSHNHNLQVVNAEALHSQPNHNLQVVDNAEEHTTSRQVVCNQVVKEVNLNNQNSSNLLTGSQTVLDNREVEELLADGISAQQITDSLETLLPLYQAEGIKPSASVLMAGIRQLQADAR
jgi:DNA-binding Lrp family transcriptional regulator